MNLFEKVTSASNAIDATKIEIKNEILNKCAKYLNSEEFDAYLEKRMDKNALDKRTLTLYTDFWEYHSGCSATHFRCANWYWFTPDCEKYSWDSHYYKGVRLEEIHKDIVEGFCGLLKEAMMDKGFSNIHINRKINNLGYAEYEVIIRW